MECFCRWAILFGLLNSISVEMWSNLVSEHIFVHVFHHRPPRKYDFFCLLYEFSMEGFQTHVITSSSAIHSTPQPPPQLRNCLPPPSTEDGIQFRKIHGCHVAMHLISCTVAQFYECTMDRFQAHLITSYLVIYCMPKPPAPVQNFLTPPVNENTLAWNSHRFKGPTYLHILLPKENHQMGSNHLGTVHGMFLAMSHTVWFAKFD